MSVRECTRPSDTDGGVQTDSVAPGDVIDVVTEQSSLNGRHS